MEMVVTAYHLGGFCAASDGEAGSRAARRWFRRSKRSSQSPGCENATLSKELPFFRIFVTSSHP